jgi:hypothetical protein
MPWVVTNPIYVFDRAEQEARAERASWPAPVAAPAATLLIDGFEGRTVFAPSSMPSRMSRSLFSIPTPGPTAGAQRAWPFDWA